jgi:hypothetical protein
LNSSDRKFSKRQELKSIKPLSRPRKSENQAREPRRKNLKRAPNPAIDKALSKAVESYKQGHPVVILDEHGGPIHGREFLNNIVATGMSMEAVLVKGVPVEYWNDSAWPEILAAAHDVFFLRRTG